MGSLSLIILNVPGIAHGTEAADAGEVDFFNLLGGFYYNDTFDGGVSLPGQRMTDQRLLPGRDIYDLEKLFAQEEV